MLACDASALKTWTGRCSVADAKSTQPTGWSSVAPSPWRSETASCSRKALNHEVSIDISGGSGDAVGGPSRSRFSASSSSALQS
jgi:hypothetical protein